MSHVMSIIFFSCRQAPCHMAILRNAHVAVSILRVKGPTTQVPVGRSIHTVMTPPEERVGAVGSKPEEWGERMGGTVGAKR